MGLAVKPFVAEENAIEVIDDLTYTVNLTDPDRYWPASVTGQLGMIASPAWLEAALEDPELNQQPVGTGPFMFDSRVQDNLTRFVRNPDWWGGEVYLDAIEFVPVTDPDTRLNLFLEGELDGLHSNDPATVDTLRNEDGVQNASGRNGQRAVRHDQLDSSTVRRHPCSPSALTYATPQENYIALIGVGVSRRADGQFTPESPYYNPDVVMETDRPDDAVALAAEYCADFPENCTDNKINIERQHSGPSVVQQREAELIAEGWSVAFNVSIPGARRGRPHSRGGPGALPGRRLASVRGGRPEERQRLAHVPHDRWHLAELAEVLRRGA